MIVGRPKGVFSTIKNNTIFLIGVWTDLRDHIVAENIREMMVFLTFILGKLSLFLLPVFVGQLLSFTSLLFLLIANMYSENDSSLPYGRSESECGGIRGMFKTKPIKRYAFYIDDINEQVKGVYKKIMQDLEWDKAFPLTNN